MAERTEPSLPPAHLMQCPECGELLHAEGEDRYAYCHYCEAALKVARGASGRPLAERVATQIAAADSAAKQAYEREWQALASLLLERRELHAQMEREKAVHETSWDLRLAVVGAVGAVALLLLAAYLGNQSLILVAVAVYLGGRGAFYVIRGIVESRKQTVERQHRPRLEELSRRRRELEERMEALEEQLALGLGDANEAG